MANTINFGIDLGTTNSVIAKYNQGKVEVFKNPVGHKETLPSVVAFRKDRILVGDKAREFVDKDPENVVGSFKRKMGTSEVFDIKSLRQSKTPIELSSYVLKELKNFIYTGEAIDAAVITIPASFDTIQSNATKKAGYMAGYEEVYLLQEPIAASLAFVNKEENPEDISGQWLVYDLGGGTFDVALVKIKDGEMKVVDHQGDNFLGGLDFDSRIVERIVIPYLNRLGSFGNLEKEMKSASGKYNKLYYQLLKKAEDVKVHLSGKDTAEIEFEVEDEAGELHDVYFNISRREFENIIEDKVRETIDMIRMILERNALATSDLEHILMIGGSTYIPLVRNLIKDTLQVPVNCSIDPTVAVAVGAAYFAGTKTRSASSLPEKKTETVISCPQIQIRTAYQKTSQDVEEYFTAQIDGDLAGLYYRILRQDGGYDSGLKELKERISGNLPLVKDAYNYFNLKVFDEKNNLISDNTTIEIVHGKFNVLGQPLPNDICLEVDDYENNTTKLELIFEKNSILPLKKTITKMITKTIKHGSDERVIINVLEGTHNASPLVNNSIGAIEIKGSELSRDLLKGSDIEIVLQMSESRDLRITTYLLMSDQEFTNLFSPSEKHVSVARLGDEVDELKAKVGTEIVEANAREEYEVSAALTQVKDELDLLRTKVKSLALDDVTDEKFQLEEKKRKLAARVEGLTRDKKVVALQMEYFEAKRNCEFSVENHGSELDRKHFLEIIANEKQFLASTNTILLKSILEKINNLSFRLNWKRPEYVIQVFHYFAYLNLDDYTDKSMAQKDIETGEKALQRANYDELRAVIARLHNLLPPKKQQISLKGTGIG